MSKLKHYLRDSFLAMLQQQEVDKVVLLKCKMLE